MHFTGILVSRLASGGIQNETIPIVLLHFFLLDYVVNYSEDYVTYSLAIHGRLKSLSHSLFPLILFWQSIFLIFNILLLSSLKLITKFSQYEQCSL